MYIPHWLLESTAPLPDSAPWPEKPLGPPKGGPSVPGGDFDSSSPTSQGHVANCAGRLIRALVRAPPPPPGTQLGARGLGETPWQDTNITIIIVVTIFVALFIAGAVAFMWIYRNSIQLTMQRRRRKKKKGGSGGSSKSSKAGDGDGAAGDAPPPPPPPDG